MPNFINRELVNRGYFEGFGATPWAWCDSCRLGGRKDQVKQDCLNFLYRFRTPMRT